VSWELRSILPVWLVAVVGAVLVGVFAPDAAFTWLPVVMAGTVLLTFVIQLALQRKEGLVSRVAASLGGAVVVLAVATGILWIVGPTISS
jgi:multisubunit Na+/H+ antiporter MnhB subunit